MTAILRDLGYQKWEVSILLVDDVQITTLNKRYLNRNRTTDVISFSQFEGESFPSPTFLLGDVVISLESAQRHAREAHTTLKRELVLLLIHGILHLIGYDHEGSLQCARQMRRKERELLNALQRFYS